MSSRKDQYENPLNQYASKEMLENFSPQMTIFLWRKLWLVLARSQKDLGIEIPEQALKEMQENLENIDFEKAALYEKEFQHDVMAHIYTFGEQAPQAKAFIHLGATSVFVKDNTELIQMKEGLKLIKKRLFSILKHFESFINQYKELPCLGFTHFQSAQLVTVGKRASLWAQSLYFDYEQLEELIEWIPFRGVKGTVGTGDSFAKLSLNYDSFIKLDKSVREAFGFKKTLLSGQVYDRKIDSRILDLLSQIAQSAHKFTNDVRLLQGLKEMEEPFSEKQVGSSAMAYKRNPVLCERISGLCKYVLSLGHSSEMVASTQWLERTLDDSSNRRLTLSGAFLAVDSILCLWEKVIEGLHVFPKIIEAHIREELPFIITEQIIMNGVKKGGDRQILHEKIRFYAMESIKEMREKGIPNPFLEKIKNDKMLQLSEEEMIGIVDFTQYTGFCKEQCEEFLEALKNLH